MHAQFEEKTYEQHLTSELVHNRRLFFPPGQVLEDILGFDVAIRTSNHQFWRHFPSMYPWWRETFFMHPRGTYLRHEWWRELEHSIEHFPKLKFNCFIQAKRPDRMVRSDAAEFSFWKNPYFRYDTFSSQQKALESLAKNTSGKAIVTYACPAFHTYGELWESIKSAQLVKRSNFCEVAKLSNHTRYSFISPGNSGIGHSKPMPIESQSFEQALERLHNQESGESNLTFLVNTAKIIGEATEQLGPLRKIYYSISTTLFKESDSKLADAFAKIYAFQFVCNVRLLIGYDG